MKTRRRKLKLEHARRALIWQLNEFVGGLFSSLIVRRSHRHSRIKSQVGQYYALF
ncbi:hypothetical protein PR202_gb24340 [Eleusine coracana subsp. coracana]|uniref:Uncharacterized protein n=1 Tax=Eleusine coracana subsp. coracana TaxID=191504 RepID=A0AAV5FKU2_ELECO|nr:hypothetical protein PR202_gb24340 [Eleusine coracana subsp. coracana]